MGDEARTLSLLLSVYLSLLPASAVCPKVGSCLPAGLILSENKHSLLLANQQFLDI